MHGSNKNIFSSNLIRYAILQLQALLYNLQIVLFINAKLHKKNNIYNKNLQ